MPSGTFSTGTASFSQTEGGFSGTGNVSAVTVNHYAIPSPSNGPTVPYVYLNTAGTFKLSSFAAVGAAQYIWQGAMNNDVLNFIGFGQLNDNSGIGFPAGTVVDAWLYQASDSIGNTWYLAFGLDALQLSGQPKFPLYYSYLNPTAAGGNLKRWLTPSGTTRI